jgi:hypothetical protein
MNVKLVQIDGALPNIALMRLAAYHRFNGDYVELSRRIDNDIFEPDWDKIYASCIFSFSEKRLEHFLKQFPTAIIGGTGSGNINTVESIIGDFNKFDYSDYPDIDYSIGFLQRGCRLKCKFCVVPKKEGKPRSEQTIYDLWRGEPFPRKLHILDNDFFGNPEWRERIAEIRDGKFKVCLSQGINVRLINEEAAQELSSIKYMDTQFKKKRLYTAWDNLGDEKIFFKGVDMLENAGIKPNNLMTYMLIGFDPTETWDRIFYRFNKMVERKIMPYPMVFNNGRKDLKAFQRWVVTGIYHSVPWEEYKYKINRIGV